MAALQPDIAVTHAFGVGRGGYLYLIDGHAQAGSADLHGGDAVKIRGETSLAIRALDAVELLLVDVPLHFTPVGVWAR